MLSALSSVIRRLLHELRRRPTDAEVDVALASLVVTIDDETAIVTRTSDPSAGAPLFGSAPPRAARVRLAPAVYGETPTSAARVRLLGAAASIAPLVEVHASAGAAGTHRGQLAFDVPRRAARALGLPAAEPGDRFEGRFTHALFDDEALIEEARRAGLAFILRRGAVATLASADVAPERTASFAREVARALALVVEAEHRRVHDPPASAIQAMRDRGRRTAERGPVGRARLRRAIGWVDAAFPGEPNCFRRTLLELALDAGAARETLVFGLDVGRTGHVALKDSEDCTFDVAFEIPPGRISH